jgi:hypothetical protein
MEEGGQQTLEAGRQRTSTAGGIQGSDGLGFDCRKRRQSTSVVGGTGGRAPRRRSGQWRTVRSMEMEDHDEDVEHVRQRLRRHRLKVYLGP